MRYVSKFLRLCTYSLDLLLHAFPYLTAQWSVSNCNGNNSIITTKPFIFIHVEGSLAIGDILALSGALLYGTSNVVQEFLVKNHSIVEFLAGLGLGGSLVTGIQM